MGSKKQNKKKEKKRKGKRKAERASQNEDCRMENVEEEMENQTDIEEVDAKEESQTYIYLPVLERPALNIIKNKNKKYRADGNSTIPDAVFVKNKRATGPGLRSDTFKQHDIPWKKKQINE